MDVFARVQHTIRRHDLARAQTRVAVALSGGSDSVALAHILIALERRGELIVAGFAHLNHRLRSSADRDQRFCAEMAADLHRPVVAERTDVAQLADVENRSIEDAARTARYSFFERAREHLGADVVAVGHTRDDQAETFLLRLLRGAGARGLAGMHPRRDTIIRPLLDCRRAELRDFLSGRAIPYVHDESNDDVGIPRNRVRAELLPLLEQRFNPSIVDVLAGDADIAREEWRWMDAMAAEFAARVTRADGQVLRIDAGALAVAPPALGRLVVQRALTALAGDRPISLAHIEEVLRLCRDGGVIDLPGQRVERIASEVVLTTSDHGSRGGNPETLENLYRYPLSIPGEVQLLESGCLVTAEEAPSAPAGAALGNQGVAIIQLGRSAVPLAVRNRRPGDKFRPLGLGGGKKLQDFFVDRKVPRERRDCVPIVVDDSDRIIWVAGHGIDERFQVRDPAQAVIILRLKTLGEPA